MPAPIFAIVEEHVSQVATLRDIRSRLVDAPQARLGDLLRHDERIAAHVDGMSLAGQAGLAVCTAALARLGPGTMFAATLAALSERDAAVIERLLALADEDAPASRGLRSALGWISPAELRGVVASLLGSPLPTRRCHGLAACRAHGVDPGPALPAALGHASPELRAAGLRTAGEVGGIRFLDDALGAMRSEHPGIAFEAAWAAALMGERTTAPTMLLKQASQADGSFGRRSPLLLALLIATPEQSHRIIRDIANGGASEATRRRAVIRACGWAGNVDFIPWLITSAVDDKLARLAGEAISLITGVDLAAASLTRPRPRLELLEVESDGEGATDLGQDEDADLPWPDQQGLQTWWEQARGSFVAAENVFMGMAPNDAHCRRILANGTQRQRQIAGLRLKLLNPDALLFNVLAPAWRQHRALSH